MKRLLWVALVVAATPTISAQNPSDTSDGAEAQQLRHELRQRWNERVRQDLRLSGDQAAKLQATEDRYLEQRRDIARRQRAVNEALRGQLQPGFPADADSVRKLMDARERNRATLAQLDQDENKEISGYLSPVQHARYQMMREQLRSRILEIRERRRARGQSARPRPRMGREPRRRP